MPTSSAPKRLPRLVEGCALLAVLAIGALALAYPSLLRTLGGEGAAPAADWPGQLSPQAGALLERAFEGLDPSSLVDVHTHLAGLGTGDSGCEVHPHMRSWTNPVARVRFDLYLT